MNLAIKVLAWYTAILSAGNIAFILATTGVTAGGSSFTPVLSIIFISLPPLAFAILFLVRPPSQVRQK